MKKSQAETMNLSDLPSVDTLLKHIAGIDLPHNMKRNEARNILSESRQNLTKGKAIKPENIKDQYQQRLHKIANSLRKVINGTGVIIHTNLGRSPLSAAMFKELELLQDSYVNLELDLEDGRRGNRHDHLRPWIRALSEAENGILVNNNAAAVLLALNSLANKKEVIISRGQLVEIGGSFRIPEILRKAGSKLVEVGTTNRTHLSDYESAITDRTKLLLWVHSSNYKITGFTKSVSLTELVELGAKYEIPVMADLGSGALVPIDSFGLQREPLVSETIRSGVDVVTFSVDKLLGGPQGGIIAGKDQFINKIEQNHLLRALRPDKTQILLTQQGLRAFSKGAGLLEHIPIYGKLASSIEGLQARAKKIIAAIDSQSLSVNIIDTKAQVGSGASPSETMNSIGISLQHKQLRAAKISSCLRANEPAILGRIKDDLFLIDLKAIDETEDAFVIKALNKLN